MRSLPEHADRTPDIEILPALPATNPAEVYLSSLTDNASMRSSLRQVAGFLSPNSDETNFRWSELTWSDMVRLRAWLVTKYAFNTTNRILAAIGGVLRSAWCLGQISHEDCERLGKVQRAKGKRLPAGRHVQRLEIGALFDVMGLDKRKVQGTRDAAVLALLYGGGLRRAEVVGLDVSDVQTEEGRTIIEVLGKGNKERRVPLSENAASALHAWLAIRGQTEGPLFSTMRSPRMHPGTVLWIVKRAAGRAKVKHLSPHDLRRTHITDLSDAGVPLTVIQGMVGHENVSTTSRYTRHEERTRMNAVDKLVVPYIKEGP